MVSPQPSAADLTAAMHEAERIATMVRELPRLIFDTNQPQIVRDACVDSFFVNVRILIEFLGVRERHKKREMRLPDVTAANVHEGWECDTSPVLTEIWSLTSKHVVHFSAHRTDKITWTEPHIRGIAGSILKLWREFRGVTQSAQ